MFISSLYRDIRGWSSASQIVGLPTFFPRLSFVRKRPLNPSPSPPRFNRRNDFNVILIGGKERNCTTRDIIADKNVKRIKNFYPRIFFFETEFQENISQTPHPFHGTNIFPFISPNVSPRARFAIDNNHLQIFPT